MLRPFWNLGSLRIILLGLATLLAVGCGAPTPTATPIQPPAGAPSPTKAPTATATKRPLVKAVIAQGFDATSLLASPTRYADHRGYFQEEGIDPELQFVKGGETGMSAVVGGSAHFATDSLNLVEDAVQGGAPAVAIARYNDQFSSNVTMRKDVADRLGITAKSPIQQKIQAMRGMRIGLASAGGVTGQIARFLASKGGLDPEKDMTLLAIGTGPNQVAALREGAVEIIIRASPFTTIPVVEGWGIMLFDLARGDVPELNGIPQIVVSTNKNVVSAQPELVLGTVRALTKTFKSLRSRPDDARPVVKEWLAELDPRVFEMDWDAYIAGGVPDDPVLTTEAVKRNLDFLNMFRTEKLTITPNQVVDSRFAEQAKRELADWQP